jgi:hypothetical protein
MHKIQSTTIFDKDQVKKRLQSAFTNSSEHELLSVLKDNSFLFLDIYPRRWGVQPNFSEVPFGSKYRCDFCWLNDNSDGPEWVLVEVENPQIQLFNRSGEPTAKLTHAIEQVRSWDRYFLTNPAEKSRIFGAVSRFRYVLVVGTKEDWETQAASVWKSHFNSTGNIEIRSMDTFFKSLERFHEDPTYPSFEQHPVSRKSSELSIYCSEYKYISHWKNVLTSNA